MPPLVPHNPFYQPKLVSQENTDAEPDLHGNNSSKVETQFYKVIFIRRNQLRGVGGWLHYR